MPQQLTVFLALAFSILIAIFAVSNVQPVEVKFLTLSAGQMAVSVLMLISALLGAAVMLLLGLAREVGLRWRHRAVAQQLKTAQARVAALEATQAEAAPAATPALSSATTAPVVVNEQPETKAT